MELIACTVVLLIGNGVLAKLYYDDKKFIIASIWTIMFICVIYLMIRIYIDLY